MRIRVYIAIILLLLLLIVSQVCALGASRLSKEPTYKIWAFNSINKVTKVTIIGSGPGCPYGLNPDGWSKTIALKRLCHALSLKIKCDFIMHRKRCQWFFWRKIKKINAQSTNLNTVAKYYDARYTMVLIVLLILALLEIVLLNGAAAVWIHPREWDLRCQAKQKPQRTFIRWGFLVGAGGCREPRC